MELSEEEFFTISKMQIYGDISLIFINAISYRKSMGVL